MGMRATSSLDGPPLTINASVSGLAVYLDNWAIIDLAKGDPSRRRRFLGVLCSRGDLLFSIANAAELIGPKGQSFDAVKSFLDEIGPHWVPVELSPFKIVEREQKGVGLGEACISQDFMQAYFRDRTAGYSPGSGKVIDLSGDFFRLDPVLDWVAQSDRLCKQSAEFDEVLRTIRARQTEYKRNASALPWKFLPFNPAQPATFACFHLLRTLIAESKSHQVKKGDGLDFCHAVVASAFASVAALDKHWKRRVESLPKPNKFARIYYRQELDKMVTDIERWPEEAGIAPRNPN